MRRLCRERHFRRLRGNLGSRCRNAASFGWKLAELRSRKKLFFLDAQPRPDLVQSGDFDLSGMLAALEAQTRRMGARRIVFDALDVVLALLPSPTAQRRELYRLHEWLVARELTGVIALKADGDGTNFSSEQPLGFMQFMVDCVVLLGHSVLGASRIAICACRNIEAPLR